MTPPNLFRIRLSMIPLFLLLAAGLANSSKPPLASTKSTASRKASPSKRKALPTTYETAVEYLIQGMRPEDAATFKSYPKSDLIDFHFSWGMGIRNSLGLWDKNPKLLASCAQQIGADSIHPDYASSLLIDGIWSKLHEPLAWVDFDTVPPDTYFPELVRILTKAKEEKEDGYLSTLPGWIFHGAARWDDSRKDSTRRQALQIQARRLAATQGEISYLALLYLTSFGPYSKDLDSLLEARRKAKGDGFELPYLGNVGARRKDLLIPSSGEHDLGGIRVQYLWKNLSPAEFSVACFGSMNGKHFSSLEQFEEWQRLRETNVFVKWAWLDTITTDNFRQLAADPRRFLEVVVLCGRFFKHEIWLDDIPVTSARSRSVESFIAFMGLTDSNFTSFPYLRKRNKSPETNFSGNDTIAFRATHALASLADKMSIEELLEILDPRSIANYNVRFKTEDLAQYRVLGYVLFSTQHDRILASPRKSAFFEAAVHYWKHEHLSWSLKGLLVDLLYQLDKTKANAMFLESFRGPPPTEGSFDRSTILESMIKYDFEENRDFLRRWYWLSQNRDFGYHPSEAGAILSTLKSTSDETRKLYRQITKNPRFVPEVDD